MALAGRDRHPVLVGEAKWTRTVDGRRLAATLREKARALPAPPTDTPVGIALCARDEVRDAPGGALTVTAADIFATVPTPTMEIAGSPGRRIG